MFGGWGELCMYAHAHTYTHLHTHTHYIDIVTQAVLITSKVHIQLILCDILAVTFEFPPRLDLCTA